MYLKDKIALVTGGSRGIGQAVCRQFAEQGATVLAAARGIDRIEAWMSDLPEVPGRVIPTSLDVADAEVIERTIEQTIEKHGRIDILVNNAGITRDGLLMSMSDEQFDEVLNLYSKSLRADLEGAIESGEFRDLTLRRLKGISDALENRNVSKAAIFLNAGSEEGVILFLTRKASVAKRWECMENDRAVAPS